MFLQQQDGVRHQETLTREKNVGEEKVMRKGNAKNSTFSPEAVLICLYVSSSPGALCLHRVGTILTATAAQQALSFKETSWLIVAEPYCSACL